MALTHKMILWASLGLATLGVSPAWAATIDGERAADPILVVKEAVKAYD